MLRVYGSGFYRSFLDNCIICGAAEAARVEFHKGRPCGKSGCSFDVGLFLLRLRAVQGIWVHFNLKNPEIRTILHLIRNLNSCQLSHRWPCTINFKVWVTARTCWSRTIDRV